MDRHFNPKSGYQISIALRPLANPLPSKRMSNSVSSKYSITNTLPTQRMIVLRSDEIPLVLKDISQRILVVGANWIVGRDGSWGVVECMY